MAVAADKTDMTTNDAEYVLTDEDLGIFRPGAGSANPDWVSSDMYPCLRNISAGHIFRAVIRPTAPERPEYLTIKLPRDCGPERHVVVARWNLLWEAAQFRRRFFDVEQLPAELQAVADQGDVNVVLVPRTKSRYYEYAPLFHLLPNSTVERYGLPLLRGGQWPFIADWGHLDDALPKDFEARLSQAWAALVWRHLMPGSPMGGFSHSDPIRLLAHNLDFWLPAVTEVMQDILRDSPLVDKGVIEEPPPLNDGTVLEGAMLGNPRMGSDLWTGEQEAAEVVRWTVEEADADGRLRGIIDAVRSNRVEDDFSGRWTYAREDFERKLYRKRSKIKVRFVELTDTIPVQGPETEIVGRTVFADVLALLNERDRQIVIVLNSGVTNLTEVAELLGYSNHSAVSKRLKKIRRQAARIFNEE